MVKKRGNWGRRNERSTEGGVKERQVKEVKGLK